MENHKKNFVNPKTKKHSQLIECLWSVAKYDIMKSMKGTCQENLPGYLAEQWYRSIHGKNCLLIFENVLKLLNKYSYDVVKSFENKF
jgi:hypothetical protein